MGPLAFSLPLASSAFCLSCSNAAWVFKYLRGFGQIHFVERGAWFTWALASPCLYTVPPPCYLAPEKHSPINREDNYLSHLHSATLEGEHCKLGSSLELGKIQLNWALTGTLISWYFEDHNSHLILVVRHHLSAEDLCMAGEKFHNHSVCLPTIHLQLIRGKYTGCFFWLVCPKKWPSVRLHVNPFKKVLSVRIS